jgi:hypothetical protein
MLYRIFILTFAVMTAFIVDLDAQSKSKSKAVTPPVEEEGPPAMAVPPSYRYERRGRRDPFINPVPKPMVTEDMPVASVRPPGLKGVLVSEATVSAVVTSKETTTSVAVISTPGGKTYFARSGDPLFDAVIKEIRPDGVVFALSTPGREGTTAPREIERKVRQTPGAN